MWIIIVEKLKGLCGYRGESLAIRHVNCVLMKGLLMKMNC